MYSIKRYIVTQITHNILTGQYPINVKIPSENALAKRFNCSRLTARSSLVSLESSGIIRSVRGSGYFVTENAIVVIMIPKFIQNMSHSQKTKIVTSTDSVIQLDTEYYDQNEKLIGIVKWTLSKDLYLDISQNSKFDISICDYIISENIKGYNFNEFIEIDKTTNKTFITREYFDELENLIYKASSWYIDLKAISLRLFKIS